MTQRGVIQKADLSLLLTSWSAGHFANYHFNRYWKTQSLVTASKFANLKIVLFDNILTCLHLQMYINIYLGLQQGLFKTGCFSEFVLITKLDEEVYLLTP